MKGGVTIKSLLMAPRDQDPMLKRSGVIYKYKCDSVGCDEEYIGESSRTFGERFKEHQKAPSPIYDHYNITGHNIKLENFSIVGKEDQNLMRAIKKAMNIRANDPFLNRNVGKYHLPHIWDEVLFNIQELKNNIEQWLFHLPLGYNICQSSNLVVFHLPPGNNICQHFT